MVYHGASHNPSDQYGAATIFNAAETLNSGYVGSEPLHEERAHTEQYDADKAGYHGGLPEEMYSALKAANYSAGGQDVAGGIAYTAGPVNELEAAIAGARGKHYTNEDAAQKLVVKALSNLEKAADEHTKDVGKPGAQGHGPADDLSTLAAFVLAQTQDSQGDETDAEAALKASHPWSDENAAKALGALVDRAQEDKHAKQVSRADNDQSAAKTRT